MTILCTVSGEDYFKEIFNDHQYIKIISLSQNHIFLKNKYVQIFALQQKIVSPNYINVAILAFWWCILKDVKVIEFYGADFSFYQNLRLDQNTGEPTLSTDYFYLEEKSKVPKNTRKYISEKPKKMHERFYQIWLAFDQMSLLSEVARKKNLQVTNYSKNTSLDTIKRSI